VIIGVGQVAEGVLAADDGAVRAALSQELIRVKGAEPAAALGVAPDASAEAVRARFLALVKQYHPNRFARRPPDVVKLANEVFLHLRRAHQRLTERPPAAASASAPTTTATTSAGAAAVVAARTSDVSPPSQPRLDVDAALAARRRRVRQHPSSSGATPPSAAIELLERTRKREEEQKERFETALADLGQGRLPNARTALRALVAESPADRRYRAYLHYVTGRLHESVGRASEAVVEYDRALGFDAELELARAAREQLAGPSENGGASRFGRWFRK
jgi:tetratricopeptide (TPR) repeat protein